MTNAYRIGDDRPDDSAHGRHGQDLAKHGRARLSALTTRWKLCEKIRSTPNLLYAGHAFRIVRFLRSGRPLASVGRVCRHVRVDDLQIHPRTSDLVIGTHGRSIDILDDTRPLRELTPEIMAKPAHLFSVRAGARFLSRAGFVGLERERDLSRRKSAGRRHVTVWVKEFTGDEIKIAITKCAGQPVANLKAAGTRG